MDTDSPRGVVPQGHVNAKSVPQYSSVPKRASRWGDRQAWPPHIEANAPALNLNEFRNRQYLRHTV